MIALYALAAALEPSPASMKHPLVETFVSACIDGRIEFAPGAARQVAFRDLPAAIRRPYGRSTGGSYYEILTPSRGYLILWRSSEASKRSMYKETCAVAAPRLPYQEIYSDILQMTVGPVPNNYPKNPVLLEFFNTRGGYAVSAGELLGEWAQVKIIWPSEKYEPVLQRFENHPAVEIRRSKNTGEEPATPKQDQ